MNNTIVCHNDALELAAVYFNDGLPLPVDVYTYFASEGIVTDVEESFMSDDDDLPNLSPYFQQEV